MRTASSRSCAASPSSQALDEEELKALRALLREERFARGALLFRENDPGGTLFILDSGQVELSVTDEQREHLVLEIVGPGGFFGEMSLLDGGRRSTAARAVSAVVTYTLQRGAFLQLLRQNADAALGVLVALTGRIRKTNALLRRRMRNPNEVVAERETFSERVADGMARFGGSWWFILCFLGTMVAWVIYNARARPPFDPFPFILLNLFLSMVAAVQAPVIMMSQNRQDQKDRIRNELDYQVNLRAELEIMQLHEKIDRLREELLGEREKAEPPA